jgi:hypothetical protein
LQHSYVHDNTFSVMIYNRLLRSTLHKSYIRKTSD